MGTENSNKPDNEKLPQNGEDKENTEPGDESDNGGEGGEGGNEVDPAELKKELDSLKARNKALQEENTKRRLENKKLKEGAPKEDKKKPQEETIESVREAANKRLKSALIRSELASVASDAHDHDLLRKALGKDLDDVDVDLDDESVDRNALEELVVKIREKKPFLFKAAAKEGGEGETKKNGAPLPRDNGRPVGSKTEAAHWKLLKQQGRHEEARAYYNTNRLAIMSQMS